MRLLLAVAVVALLSGSAFAEEVRHVPDSELALGGIEIDDNEASVVTQLGNPIRKVPTDYLGPALEYAGLTVWLEEPIVVQLESTDPRFCTPSKVCVGMTAQQVKAVYGPAMAVRRGDLDFMEYYAASGASCWLQFAVPKGIVMSIAVKCQP